MKKIMFVGLTCLIATSSLAEPATLPANDINCNDFSKRGPDKWIADGEIHFKLDGRDITFNNSVISPGTKTATGVDMYALLESLCGGH